MLSVTLFGKGGFPETTARHEISASLVRARPGCGQRQRHSTYHPHSLLALSTALILSPQRQMCGATCLSCLLRSESCLSRQQNQTCLSEVCSLAATTTHPLAER